MTNILVAYASKRRSTAEIADAIAETLRQSGLRFHLPNGSCVSPGAVSADHDVGHFRNT